jgi:hypothetical protein
MDLVLEDLEFQLSSVEVWETTKQKARQVSSLIRKWDDRLAAQVFEENVALDVPFAERRMRIEGLVGELGGLSDSLETPIRVERSDSPLHMIWAIPAARGALSCEIRLSPKTPSLVQTFQVTKDSR